MSTSILELKNVTKIVNSKLILDDVSLTINKGQTLTILGKNGMGKSTLLKLIAGLISITRGERIVVDNNVKVSYVPEYFPKINFTVNDYLCHMGSIFGLKKEETKDRLTYLYNKYNLGNMVNVKITELSKGSAQKVAVIHALMTRCPLLILDEPLSGQDALSQTIFMEMINELKKEGTTIVLACHEVHLIESVSDRIVIMDKGKITSVQMKGENDNPLMMAQFRNMNTLGVRLFENLDSVTNIDARGEIIDVIFEKEGCDAIIFAALKAGMSIISLNDIRS